MATKINGMYAPDGALYVTDTNGAGTTTSSKGYKSAVTITRPANATAYTAVDNIGGALTITGLGPSAGGEVVINTAKFEADIAAVPAGMTTCRLYMYNVTPPSALADNAAWDLPSGDRASYIGYVDLGTLVDLGSTLVVETAGINKQFTIPSGGTVYGYLVTAGGFTPAGNSEVYKITLSAVAV